MRIPLDRSATVPLWRQIERFVRAEIESGSLPAATRLPSSRSLADDLDVSRVTVDRAFTALIADGLLVAYPGSGTYVAGVAPRGDDTRSSGPWPSWQGALSVDDPHSSGPSEPAPADTISFTGVGDPALFPARGFAVTIADVLRTHGAAALGYGADPLGWPPLRATLTHLLASQGIHTGPDRILVTSGSQQGLFLVCHALLERGDTVVVERPTYDGALRLFHAIGVRVRAVDVDADGMRVEQLAALLPRDRPKLIYTMPTFQNPTGACMPARRRHELLDLARTYEVPVVEDDFVADLRYDGHTQPALKALDHHGGVIYVGTLSKLLMPGIRIGFVVADGPILAHLGRLKQAIDLSTSPFLQQVVDRYVTVGRYQTHLRRSIRAYRARRDALLESLARDLPEVSVTSPRGGLFAWVTLPDGASSSNLHDAALRRGVNVAPGRQFFARPAEGERHLRLNFAVLEPARIEEGVRRLAMALADTRPTELTS